MQRIKTAFVALVALIGGCAAPDPEGGPQIGHPDTVEVDKIKVGLERAKVVALLGPPQKTETRGATEFLFYTLPWPMKPYSYSPILKQRTNVGIVGIRRRGRYGRARREAGRNCNAPLPFRGISLSRRVHGVEMVHGLRERAIAALRQVGWKRKTPASQSHAQYGEDLVLWSALSDIEAGFYIDVGAMHPNQDTVTKLFYDRGWSGINIEPRPLALQEIAKHRPRDINLAVAVADKAGTGALYEVPSQPGLSTFDANLAAQHASNGFPVSDPAIVPVTTLAQICTEHVRCDIHFLKIDVENHERAVLAGADFKRFRPWVLAIEATIPGTYTPNHEHWESIVMDAGYTFALFKDINRYYVANERAELVDRIQNPEPGYLPSYR